MAKRGRPKGHKLSEESKQKISVSKTGYIHSGRTKKKISKSLKKYFRSPAGIEQREKNILYLNSYWTSEEGQHFKESLGKSMSKYYDENFREQ